MAAAAAAGADTPTQALVRSQIARITDELARLSAIDSLQAQASLAGNLLGLLLGSFPADQRPAVQTLVQTAAGQVIARVDAIAAGLPASPHHTAAMAQTGAASNV